MNNELISIDIIKKMDFDSLCELLKVFLRQGNNNEDVINVIQEEINKTINYKNTLVSENAQTIFFNIFDNDNYVMSGVQNIISQIEKIEELVLKEDEITARQYKILKYLKEKTYSSISKTAKDMDIYISGLYDPFYKLELLGYVGKSFEVEGVSYYLITEKGLEVIENVETYFNYILKRNPELEDEYFDFLDKVNNFTNLAKVLKGIIAELKE